MEERKPLYFREGASGVKQFQEMNDIQRKEYLDNILQLEEDVLDFRDKYILNFYLKIYYPDFKKKENHKHFISMDGL